MVINILFIAMVEHGIKSSLMKCKICGSDSDEEPRDDKTVEERKE